MPNTLKLAPHYWAWLLLSLLLGTSLLSGLQARPLYKVQEVRVAETAREMLLSGDYAIPRLNGELRLQKPPLPYWLSAASYQLFGVSAWAARLPSVLASLLTALLLFEWLRRNAALPSGTVNDAKTQARSHYAAAINSALVLATSFLALRYGRSAEADAGLMLWISAACLCGYQVVTQNQVKPWPALGLALFSGLAFLSKGPAGLAIPLLVTAGFAVLEHKPRRLAALLNWRCLLLLLLVAGAWYGWLWLTMPDLLQSYVGKQVDETFISGNHAQPAWWYLAHIWEFFMPWILLLPAALYSLYQDYFAQRKASIPLPLKFATLWLLVVLVLLSLTVNKQTQYALLLAPPLAIVLGYFVATLNKRRWLRWSLYLAVLGLGIALIVALGKTLGWSFNSAHAQSIFSNNLWLVLMPGIMVLLAVLNWRVVIHPLATPVLLISMLTCLLYNVSELQRSQQTDKWDARNMMLSIMQGHDLQTQNLQTQNSQTQHLQSQALLQLAPGDGALSFYSPGIVAVIKPEAIAPKLAHDGHLLIIGTQQPTLPGITALPLRQVGEFTLWQLSLAHAPSSSSK